jgi:hypothetical protein
VEVDVNAQARTLREKLAALGHNITWDMESGQGNAVMELLDLLADEIEALHAEVDSLRKDDA